MVFAIPTTASAYNTYVGLKIESVNNPGYSSPTTWCLPVGTVMTTKFGTSVLDTATTGTTTCPGATIWSNIVTLIADNDYTINIVTTDTPEGGYAKGAYQWYGKGVAGDSCITYCASLGSACIDPGTAVNQMTGNDWNSVSWCHVDCWDTNNTNSHSPYCATCLYFPGTSGGYTCDALNAGKARYCCCGESLNFVFTFTAPAA